MRVSAHRLNKREGESWLLAFSLSLLPSARRCAALRKLEKHYSLPRSFAICSLVYIFTFTRSLSILLAALDTYWVENESWRREACASRHFVPTCHKMAAQWSFVSRVFRPGIWKIIKPVKLQIIDEYQPRKMFDTYRTSCRGKKTHSTWSFLWFSIALGKKNRRLV